MSWRDLLQPASFRGVAFKFESADASGGRRAQTHEYPMRDTPWTEDLGRKARTVSLNAYVLGADYMAARDALIAALDAAGAGTLVHRYWGELQVVVIDYRVSESSGEGGIARFSISFAEAGSQTFPAARTDTAEALASQVGKTRAAAQKTYAAVHRVAGLPDWVSAAAVADFSGALDAIDNLTAQLTPDLTLLAEIQLAAGRVAGMLGDLIRVPASAAAAIDARIRALAQVPSSPRDAFTALTALFGHDGATTATATIATTATPATIAAAATAAATTPSNRQATINRGATAALVRQLAVTEAAGLLQSTDFDSAVAAAEARDTVLDALDSEAAATPDDALFRALSSLAAAVTRAVAARSDSLAHIGTVRFSATLPALVVAHRVYGDATRADEIVSRNRVRHPGFVPGGIALEVAT